MIEIEGKKVLVIMPFFFEYHLMVKDELTKLGAKVTLLENKLQKLDPFAVRSKILPIRKFYYKFHNCKEEYVKKVIYPQIKGEKFDYFIAINGFSITPSLLALVKAENKDIKTVLYLWDTLEIFDWRQLFKLFDKVITFDRKDSKTENIGYLPNFFPSNLNLEKSGVQSKNYDLFFIGTQHHDRYSFLSKIYYKYHSNHRLFIKLLIKYKVAFHNTIIYKLLKISNANDYKVKNYITEYELFEQIETAPFIIYKNFPYKEVEEIFNQSKAVLDIDLPYQTGYSHRLILALACGKKVITTNKWITDEPFFNTGLIQVIDRETPDINFDWVNTDTTEQISEQMIHLRIDNWIADLLS